MERQGEDHPVGVHRDALGNLAVVAVADHLRRERELPKPPGEGEVRPVVPQSEGDAPDGHREPRIEGSLPPEPEPVDRPEVDGQDGTVV